LSGRSLRDAPGTASPSTQPVGANRSVLLVLGAYTWWGLSALYWRQLAAVAPLDQLAWRVLSGFVVLAVVAVLLGRRPAAGATLRQLGLGAVAAALIATNWLTFLWAVANEQAVEASLGYFLMPVFSAALGVVVQREHLNRTRAAALGLAVVGVAWLVGVSGRGVPWVALLLGSTFALYGLVKARTTWDAVEGLTVEVAIVAPAALVLLLVRLGQGVEVTGGGEPLTLSLLAVAGVVTVVPLVLFSSAARRVPLVVVGLLQYLNPTLQFLVGWRIFGEPMDGRRLVGFGFVWAALVLIVASELGGARRRR
jgi:chloramphenicol-sensitive protein RarD